MDEDKAHDGEVSLGANTGEAGTTGSVAALPLPLPRPTAHERRYGDATIQGTGTTILGDVVHNTYYHVHEVVEQAVKQVSQATTGSAPAYFDKDELSRVISETLMQHMQQNQAFTNPSLAPKQRESEAQDNNEPSPKVTALPSELRKQRFGRTVHQTRLLLVATEDRCAELSQAFAEVKVPRDLVDDAFDAELVWHALADKSRAIAAVLIDGDGIELLSSRVPSQRRDSQDTYAFSSSACRKLLSFTRQGGTTVFGYPFLGNDSVFVSFLSQMWHMPWWRVGSHVATDTLVRNTNARNLLTVNMQDTCNAAGTVRLGEVSSDDALYVDRESKDASHNSPFVLAKYGKGRLGFFGGHFDDEETLPLLLAMLGLNA